MQRKLLIGASSALLLLTLPAVWALGYMDHPWHLHAAANAVAAVAVIGAAVLHALRGTTVPPVPSWLTWATLVMTTSSLGISMFWDELGGPSDSHVLGGVGPLFIPLAAVLVAWVIAGVVVSLVTRRVEQVSSSVESVG